MTIERERKEDEEKMQRKRKKEGEKNVWVLRDRETLFHKIR